MSREGIRCTYRQIRDAEYTLAPRFVPLSGLVAELGRAGCNETIVERKNEKEFLACLRNRDRAGPKFTLRQCTLRRLSAPETALRALSFRPHFFLLPLSFFAPFLPALSVSISSCWMALDSRANSTLRSETAEIPRRRVSLQFATKNAERLREARRLRNTRRASLYELDPISFRHYFYEKFLRRPTLSFALCLYLAYE